MLHVALCPMGYDCWTRLTQSRMPLGADVAVDSNNGICLQAYREALGITGVSLDVNPGGQIPYEGVMLSIRLFTEQVIPKFR